uniref:Lysosomal beta glucosidase-like n=1 Tax=Tanacetum cinerariifolium TaxID=118510 RepID=A0A6L2NMM3_TANCI|nr:lysosomal beta glucosidase-like [Tanacetum cinerariifolium]
MLRVKTDLYILLEIILENESIIIKRGLQINEVNPQGIVILDWEALDSFHVPYGRHYRSDDLSIIGARVNMVGSHVLEDSVYLVESWEIPVSRIDNVVERILKVKFAVSLFKYPTADISLLDITSCKSEAHISWSQTPSRLPVWSPDNGDSHTGSLFDTVVTRLVPGTSLWVTMVIFVTELMLEEKFRDLCEEVSNFVKEIEDVVKEVERLSCKYVAKETVCLLRRGQKHELYMMTRLQMMVNESHLSVREKHTFVSKMNLGRLD